MLLQTQGAFSPWDWGSRQGSPSRRWQMELISINKQSNNFSLSMHLIRSPRQKPPRVKTTSLCEKTIQEINRYVKTKCLTLWGGVTELCSTWKKKQRKENLWSVMIFRNTQERNRWEIWWRSACKHDKLILFHDPHKVTHFTSKIWTIGLNNIYKV